MLVFVEGLFKIIVFYIQQFVKSSSIYVFIQLIVSNYKVIYGYVVDQYFIIVVVDGVLCWIDNLFINCCGVGIVFVGGVQYLQLEGMINQFECC